MFVWVFFMFYYMCQCSVSDRTKVLYILFSFRLHTMLLCPFGRDIRYLKLFALIQLKWIHECIHTYTIQCTVYKAYFFITKMFRTNSFCSGYWVILRHTCIQKVSVSLHHFLVVSVLCERKRFSSACSKKICLHHSQ